jgi:hypothetical protein
MPCNLGGSDDAGLVEIKAKNYLRWGTERKGVNGTYVLHVAK